MNEKLRKLAAAIAALKGVEAKQVREETENTHGIKDERQETVSVLETTEIKVQKEKTEFAVVLTSVGEKKMQVIKTVKDLFGLGLKEAKELVDDCVTNSSSVLAEALPKISAESFKQQLEEVGASIELK